MRNIKKMEHMHFECLQGMYFSKIVADTAYTLVFSDLIEDTYYNYCSLLQFENSSFLNEWNEIKKKFPDDRIPALYVSPSSDLYGGEKNYLSEFQKEYTDAWMVLQEGKYLNTLSSNPQISVNRVISKEEFMTFVDTFTIAYSGDDPNDPYGQLSPTYTKALLNSWNCNDKYKRTHYLALLNEKPVGVATAIKYNNLVAVYNVGTASEYRRHGVGEAIMSNIVKDLNSHEILFLQTEKGSNVETWYNKMGFETLFLGECYIEKKE